MSGPMKVFYDQLVGAIGVEETEKLVADLRHAYATHGDGEEYLSQAKAIVATRLSHPDLVGIEAPIDGGVENDIQP